MGKIWYMDDSDEDQHLEHHCSPPHFISVYELRKMTGVLYWKLNTDALEEGELDKHCREQNYVRRDVIEVGPDKLINYEEMIKIFFQEHIHAVEEIRLVLDGSGYFDVRDCEDNWIRILIEKGDFIVLPPGMYHRFTLDSKNYIKAMRLFVGHSDATPLSTDAEDYSIKRPANDYPINRPAADDHEARTAYIKLQKQGFT